ncbi:MAG: amidase [Pseudomonadales bacterium]|nr:amidase [Pseudomonadales bacterium]
MNFSEYADYDGLGLAQLVADKQVSAQELEDCARQAIAEKNPALNAVLASVEGQPYTADQPFSGVPFLIKELVLQAAGAPSRSGCRALPEVLTPADSSLMQRFREAGLHLIGTTQTPEMGYNATTETVAFGPVHNPWKQGHSAGGSSGGSGAAVAAGIVPLAHANDGGGSIRVPASCNGLVGLKPSRDRTPTGPGAADPLFSHAIEFVVSRSVRDSAALLDCVAGPDLGAPHSIASPEMSFAEVAAKPTGPLKIAVLEGSMLGTPVHDENAQAVANTSKRLEALGHSLVECPIRLDFEEFAQHINVIWCAFAALFVEQVAQGTGCAADNDHFEAVTLTCARFGSETNAVQVLSALDYVNRITRETAQAFEEFDVMMSVALATPPPVHGTLDQNNPEISAMDWTRETFKYATNTPLFNSTGQPAISLPLHWTADDLPVGVQFAGKMGDEGLLLSLASQLEADSNWQAVQRKLWQ